MKKRIVALLLCLVMLLALVCSCGNKADEPAEPTTPAAPSEPAAPAEPADPAEPAEPAEPEGITLPLVEEPYTFSAWIGDMPFLYAYIDEWLPNCSVLNQVSAMTNVYFDWTYAAEPSTSLSLIAATGEYPDMFSAAHGWYVGGVTRGIEEGVFMPLEDIIEEKIPNLWAIMQEDPQVRREMISSDGHIGTIWSIYDDPNGGSTPPSTAMVRGDWLDALGIDNTAITTYDDYHDMLLAIYNEYGASMLIPYGGASTNQGLISGYNVAGTYSTAQATYPFYQVEGEVKFGMTQPEYKEYITMLAQWYSEGLIHEDFLTYATISRPNNDPIMNNEVSLVHWNAANIGDLLATMDEGAYFVGVKEPVRAGNEGQLNHFGYLTTKTAFGFQFSTTCSNVDLLSAWCNWGYTDEAFIHWNYGIEGETYTMVDGVPMYTDLILNNPNGIPQSLAYAVYTLDAGPYMFDTDRKDLYYEDYVIEAFNMVKDNTDYENTYFLSSKISLTGEDASLFSNIMGDIGTYIDENLVQFIMGDLPMSEWDAFVAQIETMGIQDCVDLYQKAYDAFMAN